MQRAMYCLAAGLVFSATAMARPTQAAEGVPWAPDLTTAMNAAARTHRMVLIHFWRPDCSHCIEMERTVFSQEPVVRSILENYVPLKINAREYPDLARRYEITAVPTDVIVTPSGAVVRKMSVYADPEWYVAQLNRLAAAQPPRRQNRAAAAGAGRDRPASWQGDTPRIDIEVPDSPPASSQPPADMAAAPLGLEGYCPVTLVEKGRSKETAKEAWKKGDARFGAVHRGRTYLFAGPDQQQRFLADPDAYAPVLEGNDSVAYFDQGRLVPGVRKHGVFYRGKIYLFAGEESLERFWAAPAKYADAVARAMR